MRVGASGWSTWQATGSSRTLGEQRFDAVIPASLARRPDRRHDRDLARQRRDPARARGRGSSRRAARCWRSTMAMKGPSLGDTLQALHAPPLRRSVRGAGRAGSHRACRFRGAGRRSARRGRVSVPVIGQGALLDGAWHPGPRRRAHPRRARTRGRDRGRARAADRTRPDGRLVQGAGGHRARLADTRQDGA